MACPALTFPTLDSASAAIVARRASRVLKGRRPGGTTTEAKYCQRHDGWHLTTSRKAHR